MSTAPDHLRLAADFAPATQDQWRKLVDGVETSEQRMEQLPPREPNIAEWMEHYLDQLPSNGGAYWHQGIFR